MRIKSIPDNPTITLSALNELVKMYEKIEARANDKTVPTFAYDLGRMTVFELFFSLMGVQFDMGVQYKTSDQAHGHHIDNK